MEQIGDMKLYSFDEIKDEIIGERGTPERDAYEQKLQEELQTYYRGESQKQAHHKTYVHKSQNMRLPLT